MCGIFGYTGQRTVKPLLIDGLRALEYRGYDSAGIFIPEYGAVKSVGPIDALAARITETIPGTAGIGHTRWATHGAPSEVNAHPHCDMSESVWLVHNGIIENYRELKDGLIMQGCTFVTDTDTEVLAKLVGSLYTGSLQDAVQKAVHMVRGTYGIAVMHRQIPDEIVVARMGSPIVLGIGIDGHFVASDPTAIVPYTKDVIYLDDGDVACITKQSYTISDKAGSSKSPQAERIEWDIEAVQKGGYDHFLLKEIMEIPEAVRSTLRGRLIPTKGKVKLGGLDPVFKNLTQLRKLTIVACGSAYYAGEVGKQIIEAYTQVPVEVALASEYRYRTVLPQKNEVVLAITQSGETADTLASVRKAQSLGLPTIGIVNVVGSTIARETDAGIYNHAGPEISIASTKAFISQVTALTLLTVHIARERDMTHEKGNELLTALHDLPATLEKMLADTAAIQALAQKYVAYQNLLYIGRTIHAPIAYEGALKLKEVTYTHAEAYPGGELKHGPIAMLDHTFPVVAVMPRDDVYEKMVSNVEEIKARNAPVLAITTKGDPAITSLADDVLFVPSVHSVIQPIVSLIPLYLFAYYVGIARGLNVDRPRNLAKSVTVE